MEEISQISVTLFKGNSSHIFGLRKNRAASFHVLFEQMFEALKDQ